MIEPLNEYLAKRGLLVNHVINNPINIQENGCVRKENILERIKNISLKISRQILRNEIYLPKK